MTQQEATTALQIVAAVGTAIRDLEEIPSGHLYARLMSRMSIQTYTSIIASLKSAGLVEERNHLLTWVGPKEAKS